MTLLRRIAIEHRGIVIPLAVGLAANLLGWAGVVRPRGARAAGAANRAASAATALATAERDRALAQGLVAGSARAGEALTTFYRDVLPANQEEAVRMTYASLPALARKTGMRWEKRTADVAADGPKKDQSLGQLTITMVLEGPYENFRAFMAALESAPEFLIVDDVTLAEGNKDGAPSFTVTLSTYFRAKDHGA